MADDLGPVRLVGRFVTLEPARKSHVPALWEAAKSVDWSWFLEPLRSQEAVEARVERGLRGERAGQEFAFAVLQNPEGRVIGSTSYLSVVAKHRRTEVGSTWYVPGQQGTAVNPECKLLLLQHAFEDWGAVRVEFRTDENNVHSRGAIEKLGAKLEGTSRNHGIRADGTLRNSRVYSIVPSEWPEIKTGLQSRVARFAAAGAESG
jgi:N-acetyltransferase